MTLDAGALVEAADVYASQVGECDELALGSAIETYEQSRLENQAREEAEDEHRWAARVSGLFRIVTGYERRAA